MPNRELLRKEWHECWPLAAALAGTFLLLGLVLLRLEAVAERNREGLMLGLRLTGSGSGPGSLPSGLERLALAMTRLSIAAGGLFALRQFLVPTLVGEWSFLLHRRISRGQLLGIKVGTAFILLGAAFVAVWTMLILVAGLSRALPCPPAAGTWREGLLLLSWGGMVYLAVADACLSTRPWYTTKCIVPLFVLVTVAPSPLRGLTQPLWWLLCLGALLILSLSATFLTREFEGGA